jgi:peptidoglycan/xylan/chitin deacetylase (PgdA/CDA1 family)
VRGLPRWLSGWILPALVLGACSAPGVSPPPTGTPPRAPRPTIISLTFDDGNADNFALEPVLRQYGMRATFYIPSGLVGSAAYMTWDQLRSLHSDGNEIGGHSLDHVNIGDLAGAALRHEVCDDRTNLLDHGFDPVSFAYPFGGYDDATKQMLKECGYLDGRTIGAGPDQVPPPDPYALRAFPYVVSDTDASKLQRYVVGTRQEGGGWVILIFHHVCDACDYFSVKPDVFNRFMQWLAEQQSQGRLTVKTVGEVVLAKLPP